MQTFPEAMLNMLFLFLPVRMANVPTSIVDFRGFDSSIILIIRGGIPRPIGDFPESLSQAMLVGCNVSRRIGRMCVYIYIYVSIMNIIVIIIIIIIIMIIIIISTPNPPTNIAPY